MLTYNITTTDWAGKLTGSGYPARWNLKGTYVIYTSSSRALACLENLVHRSGEGFNQNFKITEIEIPDDCSLQIADHATLPVHWYKTKNYPSCQQIGERWIQDGESLLMQVPSSIIRDETNVLINPNHHEFSKLSVKGIINMKFDERL
ncbi:MAG: RES family NAD+ phosphorylase [Balneolaceae bacterium]|nr:RES family NAD+ phosphorylase [Balneolaceae bacterium]